MAKEQRNREVQGDQGRKGKDEKQQADKAGTSRDDDKQHREGERKRGTSESGRKV